MPFSHSYTSEPVQRTGDNTTELMWESTKVCRCHLWQTTIAESTTLWRCDLWQYPTVQRTTHHVDTTENRGETAPHRLRYSFTFSSKCHHSPQEYTQMLQFISQKFPQSVPWNCTNIYLIITSHSRPLKEEEQWLLPLSIPPSWRQNCWLLTIQATCWYLLRMDLLRQLYMLPQWVANQICYLIQWQFTDSRPTSPTTNPTMPGAW